MKILYISDYHNRTSSGLAAIDYILSLDSVGINVVPRPIFTNSPINQEIPRRILDLQKKTEIGCDVVIQQVPPNMLDYNGNFDKNIAFVSFATLPEKTSHIWYFLNQMDEMWHLGSRNTKDFSSLTIPYYEIGPVIDIRKFDKEYPKITIPEVDGHFTFLHIGGIKKRKNITALLRAFHTEFYPEEPVSLIFKTQVYGQHPDVVRQEVKNTLDKIKEGLCIYRNISDYKQEIIVTHELTFENLFGLQTSSNAYVTSTYGESWNRNILNSIGFGKTPVCTDCPGTSYAANPLGWSVLSTPENAFATHIQSTDSIGGREEWYDISIKDLRHAMRECFENKIAREYRAKKCKDEIKVFSYERMGEYLKYILNIPKEKK